MGRREETEGESFVSSLSRVETLHLHLWILDYSWRSPITQLGSMLGKKIEINIK